MKELILFSAALVFIFCQDLQSSNLPLKMKSKIEASTSLTEVAFENSACEMETPDQTLDIIKELSATENPGIYYREVVLQSEPQYDHLYCISGVSSDSDMEEDVSRAVAETTNQDQEQAFDVEAWNFLTDKWTIAQKKEFCEDENRFKLNPACEDSIRLFQEQNESRSDLDQSLAIL